MSAVVRFLASSIGQVFGVCSGRTWGALIVVTVTGGALILNYRRQQEDELLQRVVCREKTTVLTGPITEKIPSSFKLVERKAGVFIFEKTSDTMTSPVTPVLGLPRFQCPFPVGRHVGKINFANAILLGLAHDPVVYFYFDELFRSDTVEKIVDHGRKLMLSAKVSDVTLAQSDDDSDDLASSASSITGLGYPALVSSHYGSSKKQNKIKVPGRSQMLPRAKDIFYRIWDSPLTSSPSKESIKAMDSGIDPTEILRVVKLYAKRQHPDRRCESIEDFVWLFLNGIAEEIQELERQLEMVEDMNLSFKDCIMGSHDVSLWCLECGRFALVETDAITVTYDKILNEDLTDPLHKSIRKCVEKRKTSSMMSSFFEPDNPCKHSAFRCLSCAPTRLSNLLVVHIPDEEILTFPMSHSLQVEHDRRRIYDVQLVIYCTHLVSKDGHGRDVMQESYSCAFRNAADGHWYFFDGNDSYYRLPDSNPRELKQALHFVPPHLLMYTARDWPKIRAQVRKAWTKPKKTLSNRRPSAWKESFKSAKRALRYVSSMC